MERAFPHELRHWLRRTASGRTRAALTGTGAALLLQSSTAVALLVAAFIPAGSLTPAIGLAVLAGADLGSALAAQLLILRPDWITPIPLLVGVGLFLRGTARRTRQIGRILIGLGLVFVSLDLIAEAAALLPLPLLGSVGDYLSRDLATAFLLGAILAWAMHSSVAAVLLTATLAASGALGGPAAIAMVLGANLGGASIPVLLTLHAPPDARRVMIANLLVRGGGAVLLVWAFSSGVVPHALMGTTAAAQAMMTHVGFNAALVALAVPFSRRLTQAAGHVVRTPPDPEVRDITALDPAALGRPRAALGCARREILRMGEEIEAMLRAILPLYRTWDEAAAEDLLRREARVDRMHFQTKLYLSRLMRTTGSVLELEPAADLAALASQLEAAGDEISSTMLAMARRVHTDTMSFSDAGWTELEGFHDRVLANVQQALLVIMTPEVDVARTLVEEKDALRQMEERLQLSHLSRLRSGLSESVETSNIHQQTLRCLKQVNSAFATAAHPILREAGEILSSRLARQVPPDRAVS